MNKQSDQSDNEGCIMNRIRVDIEGKPEYEVEEIHDS